MAWSVLQREIGNSPVPIEKHYGPYYAIVNEEFLITVSRALWLCLHLIFLDVHRGHSQCTFTIFYRALTAYPTKRLQFYNINIYNFSRFWTTYLNSIVNINSERPHCWLPSFLWSRCPIHVTIMTPVLYDSSRG